MSADDMELLRQYVTKNSEDAFATLVRRHVNLIYSVALRQMRDSHRAEEVTQATFIILARKAPYLGRGTILSAWLCRTAQRVVADVSRMERRRLNREHQAYMESLVNQPESKAPSWTAISVLLDAAMAALSEKDHSAVVLRFFEGKDLKEVAAALGVSEGAARTRVSRAVEKLRIYFGKRGVVASAAVIAAAISENSVKAAPTALANSAISLSLAKGSAGLSSTPTIIKGALKLMAWTKMQTAVVTVVVISMGAYSVIQHQAQVKLREANEALARQHAEALARLKTENESLSQKLATASDAEAAALAKLRDALAQRTPKLKPTTATPEAPTDTKQANASVKLPVDSWSKSGFATPESTLKTRGWAILNGDREEFAQSVHLTDGARKMIEDMVLQMAANSTNPDAPRIAQQALAQNWGAEEAILMPMIAENQNNHYMDYDIISQQSPSDNEVDMAVETESASGSPKTETLKFQRFGDDWKIVVDETFVQSQVAPAQ